MRLAASAPRRERDAEHDRRPDELDGVRLETKPRKLHDRACLQIVSPAAASARNDMFVEPARGDPRRAADAMRFQREQLSVNVEEATPPYRVLTVIARPGRTCAIFATSKNRDIAEWERRLD